MPVGDDTYATRRHLPHLAKRYRTYFVTFATRERLLLPPAARQIALDCCSHDHDVTYWLHTAVVMPDHVHMLFVPIGEWTLDQILRRVKGVSARRINQELQRRGPLWQDESFDRILRSDEDVQRKGEYIAHNPVRKGIVTRPEDYPWLWRTGNPASPQDRTKRPDRQDCLSSTFRSGAARRGVGLWAFGV